MHPCNETETLAQEVSIIVEMDPTSVDRATPTSHCLISVEEDQHDSRQESDFPVNEIDNPSPALTVEVGKVIDNGGIMDEGKSALASLLEVSPPREPWTFGADRPHDIEAHDLFMNLGRNISKGLRPVLIVLRSLGYFPGFVLSQKRQQRTLRIYRVLLFLLVAAVILANLYFFRRNVFMLIVYHEKFGFLHATTVSTIITGIKPFINAVLLLMFSIRIRSHLKMLRTMDAVDLSFRSAFNISPPIRKYSSIFLAFNVAFSICVPFCYRIFEVVRENSNMPEPRSIMEWEILLSFVVVPLLTTWNVLPLVYYVLVNRIVCFWCKTLTNSLKKEQLKRQFSLKFYYAQFLRITTLQKSIGSLFNPFVFFALAWSLLMLSLTIYFITQPTSSLVEPITIKQMSSNLMRRILTERVYLNLGWSAIQIFLAILHICVICWTGLKTNEETRKIVNTVLMIVPDTNADLDRFQISCFVHKTSFQQMWGMSVWRTFPLERTTFFTLISVVVTYSFLLLKLKDNPAVSPIVRQIIVTNETFGC